MSCSLSSLRGGEKGVIEGSIIVVIKGILGVSTIAYMGFFGACRT